MKADLPKLRQQLSTRLAQLKDLLRPAFDSTPILPGSNRALTEEEIAFFKPRAEAYRRLRQAGRALRKWEKEVREILESIERERRSTDGLSELYIPE